MRSTHAVNTPGLIGVRNQMVTAQLPFTLTEFYTPGVRWNDSFADTADPIEGPSVNSATQVDGRSYEKGRVTEVRWNVGVNGPAFPRNDFDPNEYAALLLMSPAFQWR